MPDAVAGGILKHRGVSARWTIQTTIAEAKQQTRLAQDELRYWPSWQRHIALLMLAHASWIPSPRGGGKTPPGLELADSSTPHYDFHQTRYCCPNRM